MVFAASIFRVKDRLVVVQKRGQRIALVPIEALLIDAEIKGRFEDGCRFVQCLPSSNVVAIPGGSVRGAAKAWGVSKSTAVRRMVTP